MIFSSTLYCTMVIDDVMSLVYLVGHENGHRDNLSGRGVGLCIGLHACVFLRLRRVDHDHDGVRDLVPVHARDVPAKVHAHDVRVRLHDHRL